MSEAMARVVYHKNLRDKASPFGGPWHYYNACLAHAVREWRKTNTLTGVQK